MKPRWDDKILGKHLEWNDDGVRTQHEGYQIYVCPVCKDEYPIALYSLDGNPIKPRKTCGKESCFLI